MVEKLGAATKLIKKELREAVNAFSAFGDEGNSKPIQSKRFDKDYTFNN